MKASQKFETFPTIRRPQTYFRHAQGRQRASVLTGSNKIVQNTNFTVYEVESQKTAYTKH